MSGTDNTRPYHVQAADPLVLRVRERGIHGLRDAEPELEPLFYGGCNGDPFTKRERKAANRKSRAEGRKLSRDALSALPSL